uniref:Alpha-1,3-mannosyl-glycoprotein 2-beta-N-acetylglucosaminyltransferase n=1 Tax=Magallana gigas TaxID=29159 RepID=A0A8W8HMI1_MAGGI
MTRLFLLLDQDLDTIFNKQGNRREPCQVVSERHSKADKMGDWSERISVEEVLKLNISVLGLPLTVSDRSSVIRSRGTAECVTATTPPNSHSIHLRMLVKLLGTSGVRADMITVFIDGFFQEPLEVTRLLGLRGIQHTPQGKKNARVSQHYKASLTATFDLHPALYTIVIEEDLDVSPYFFNYFSQTLHLMEKDSSLYCISAWNDQGYSHSCKDPRKLYRVETMPGLGWLLKKKLFKDELEKQWPSSDKQWDWDMWMRLPTVRKNRECIIPDVSRTYHFGSKGLNMNPYFQEVYFKKHSIVNESNVALKDLDRMTADKYEVMINEILKSAVVVDHTKDPCESGLVPDNKDAVHVMYIQMPHPTDFTTWKQLAKSMWRLYLNGTPVILVGVPASPYHSHKPDSVKPFVLEEPSKKAKAQ